MYTTYALTLCVIMIGAVYLVTLTVVLFSKVTFIRIFAGITTAKDVIAKRPPVVNENLTNNQ